jgi:hypothetical protein
VSNGIRVIHARTRRVGTVVTAGAACGVGGDPSAAVLLDGDSDWTLIPHSSLVTI